MANLKKHITKFICVLSVLMILGNISISDKVIGFHSYQQIAKEKVSKKINKNDKSIDKINLAFEFTKEFFDKDGDFSMNLMFIEHSTNLFYVSEQAKPHQVDIVNQPPLSTKYPIWIRNRQILI